ncbi:LOW QUALITY PROTEIN: uncharacterized acetyltransferase At3g50280 [Ricinus communis]|uniref:LOW QUALITY PROTEIN: uncharacterized acetyltransferase At3g50280 n=1 Tax=Ricinus communis TaxID=3988 RepID=UPI00201A7AB2|nr:LOW QUALITY PROTEIN: uncharacterized acetyltransferase At3g50280 [Ricinus communis]
MAGILLLCTSTVSARAFPGSIQKLELSSSDVSLILLQYIQMGILFPNPEPSQVENLIQHLKTSLSRTLDFFFPLAGRLATAQQDDTTICYFIDCNNAAAHFVHAVAESATVSDILEPFYVPPSVHSFFPLNGCKNYEGVSKPLLAVQVTELADRVFIGFAVNHVVADGTAFWNFINSWSEISRGSDQISEPPLFEHWFRGAESYCPISLPLALIKTDDESTPPQFRERILHFGKETIGRLRAKANAEAGTDRISSLQSILAHVWRSVIRNKQLDPSQETTFRLPIEVRSRMLQSKLPKGYFGNAFLIRKVNSQVREPLDEQQGLGYAALQMNKAIACYTEDNIRNDIESWIKSPNLGTVSELSKNALGVGNSPRFNVYGNDFGWGRPIAVRSGLGNKFDGKIIVFPGAKECNIDLQICLNPDVMHAMENDPEFLAACS